MRTLTFDIEETDAMMTSSRIFGTLVCATLFDRAEDQNRILDDAHRELNRWLIRTSFKDESDRTIRALAVGLQVWLDAVLSESQCDDGCPRGSHALEALMLAVPDGADTEDEQAIVAHASGLLGARADGNSSAFVTAVQNLFRGAGGGRRLLLHLTGIGALLAGAFAHLREVPVAGYRAPEEES